MEPSRAQLGQDKRSHLLRLPGVPVTVAQWLPESQHHKLATVTCPLHTSLYLTQLMVKAPSPGKVMFIYLKTEKYPGKTSGLGAHAQLADVTGPAP